MLQFLLNLREIPTRIRRKLRRVRQAVLQLPKRSDKHSRIHHIALQRIQHSAINLLHRPELVIPTNGRTSLMVTGTAVDVGAVRAIGATHHGHATPARGAFEHARQEIFRLDTVDRPSADTSPAHVRVTRGVQPRLNRRPELWRHNAQPWLFRHNPFVLWPRECSLSPVLRCLAGLVPNHTTVVERATQDLVHTRRGPSGRSVFSRPRRDGSVVVQFFCDRPTPHAIGASLKDPAHDRGLGLVGPQLDMGSTTVQRDWRIDVPEHSSAVDAAVLSDPDFGFLRLAANGPAVFGCKHAIKEPGHVPLKRSVFKAPAAVIEPNLDAGPRELFEFPERLVSIATREAILRLHHHGAERTRGPQNHVDHALPACEPARLNPADAVVNEYVRGVHSPALRYGKVARILDLPGHRFGLVRDAPLLARLPRVYGGDHEASALEVSTKPTARSRV